MIFRILVESGDAPLDRIHLPSGAGAIGSSAISVLPWLLAQFLNIAFGQQLPKLKNLCGRDAGHMPGTFTGARVLEANEARVVSGNGPLAIVCHGNARVGVIGGERSQEGASLLRSGAPDAIAVSIHSGMAHGI
jgi:hypothetical protein